MYRAFFVYQIVAHGVDIFLDFRCRNLRQMAVGLDFFQIEFFRPQGILAPLELRLVDLIERFPGPNPVIKMIQFLSCLVPSALHDCLGIFLFPPHTIIVEKKKPPSRGLASSKSVIVRPFNALFRVLPQVMDSYRI